MHIRESQHSGVKGQTEPAVLSQNCLLSVGGDDREVKETRFTAP
jgi:hypothetical protein